jgi:hypothetical protein
MSWEEEAFEKWKHLCYDSEGDPVGYRQLKSRLPIGERYARRLAKYVRRLKREQAKTILVIGDAHFEPDQNMARATWAGRMIEDIQPDAVVVMGDWGEFGSLSHWDKGTIRMEGRRYREDIQACNQAIRLLEAELSTYSGEKHFITGNHEHRIVRAVESKPELHGFMGLDDLHWDKFGWKTHNFLAPAELQGVLFSHYFHPRGSNRAISGKHVCQNLLGKLHVSCVVGHNHILDYARDVDARGFEIMALSVGCYFEEHHEWANQSNHHYWRGICLLHGAREGRFDLETFSMGRIKDEWAGRR